MTKKFLTGISTQGAITVNGTTSPIVLNGSLGTSGQVLTSNGAGSTPSWTTISGGTFTGGTLTSSLTLRSGNSATGTAPLYFGSSTPSLLTTPIPGAMEYDGIAFYSTPENNAGTANSGRALDWASHIYNLNTGTSNDYSIAPLTKSILSGDAVGIILLAGITYEFELYASIRHQSFGDTVAFFSHGWNTSTNGGTPTVSWSEYFEHGNNTTGFTTATTLTTTYRTTGTINISSSPGATGSRYTIYRSKGTLRVTGTGSIKFYPTLTASQATANALTVSAGSFFKVTPIGNGTVTTVGTWA